MFGILSYVSKRRNRLNAFRPKLRRISIKHQRSFGMSSEMLTPSRFPSVDQAIWTTVLFAQNAQRNLKPSLDQ